MRPNEMKEGEDLKLQMSFKVKVIHRYSFPNIISPEHGQYVIMHSFVRINS